MGKRKVEFLLCVWIEVALKSNNNWFLQRKQTLTFTFNFNFVAVSNSKIAWCTPLKYLAKKWNEFLKMFNTPVFLHFKAWSREVWEGNLLASWTAVQDSIHQRKAGDCRQKDDERCCEVRIELNEPLYNARLGDRGKWPLVEVRPYLFCFILAHVRGKLLCWV